MAGLTGAVGRRLEALEARAREERRRRAGAACELLLDTMTAEHIAIIHAGVDAPWRALGAANPAGETFAACLLRTDPPALVRAALMLLAWHLEDGLPLALPDYVAQVYVDDPEAIPANLCDGCSYPLPIRGRVLPSGVIEPSGAAYIGPCPICGQDAGEVMA